MSRLCTIGHGEGGEAVVIAKIKGIARFECVNESRWPHAYGDPGDKPHHEEERAKAGLLNFRGRNRCRFSFLGGLGCHRAHL